MGEELFAGMGEYVIGHNPAVLVSLGLGSCVGCVVYDSNEKVGGLAHVMLPHSSLGKNSALMNKFADIAVPTMVEEMKSKFGCKIENMTAKIAGGAHMFPGIVKEETMDIGGKNAQSVKEELAKLNIKIVAEDVGGQTGRTVRFDTITGMFNIKTKDGVKEI